MARARGDFADILLKKKMIGPDQLAEAESIAVGEIVALN